MSREAIQSQAQNLTSVDPANDKIRYSQGLRFEFAQSWNITVPADQAANVLHIAITSGANESGGISWSLKSEDALEAEAGRKALEHAHQVADRMARGLNATLGELLYASNQTPPRDYLLNGRILNTESVMASQKVNLRPLAITPERITKSATVYAVFAIR